MLKLGGLVERKVWRPDDGDSGCPSRHGVGSERDRVRGRLGTTVRGNVEPAPGGLDEEPQASLALLDREQHALAVRSEGEDSVEAGRRITVEKRAKCLLVEL
jgi:hypothetical protein